MIDFSNCEINYFRNYGGANGNKFAIIYQGENYMLKFPPRKEKPNIYYTNGCISEYLGSHIFGLLGFEAQETLFGKYCLKGIEKEVVACKDFVADGFQLMEFLKIKNACIRGDSNSSSGSSTELEAVLEAIELQHLIDPQNLRKYFWEMFVADAYLGNFDRHNGNWGILIHEEKRQAKIAPIYDCGSCLYPQLSEENMEDILNHPAEIENRIFIFPNSALKENGKKINYFNFLNKYPECRAALNRISARINSEEIRAFIYLFL